MADTLLSADTDSFFAGSTDDNIWGDTLEVDSGSDRMTGDEGADLFVLARVTASTVGASTVGASTVGPGCDIIRDFAHRQDRIDLPALDAIAGGLDDAFAFVGTAALPGWRGRCAVTVEQDTGFKMGV